MGCVPPPYGLPTAGGAREVPLCSHIFPYNNAINIWRTMAHAYFCGTITADYSFLTTMKILNGSDSTDSKRGLGNCYCNCLAAWSITCEGHVLEFCSSYECKSSPLHYLNGPSNAALCLWPRHRKAATTGKVFLRSIGR